MTKAVTEVSTELLEGFADAWNRHDAEGLMSFMTPDCVFESSAGPEKCGTRYQGAEAVRAGYIQVWTTFPNAHWANATLCRVIAASQNGRSLELQSTAGASK